MREHKPTKKALTKPLGAKQPNKRIKQAGACCEKQTTFYRHLAFLQHRVQLTEKYLSNIKQTSNKIKRELNNVKIYLNLVSRSAVFVEDECIK